MFVTLSLFVEVYMRNRLRYDIRGNGKFLLEKKVVGG